MYPILGFPPGSIRAILLNVFQRFVTLPLSVHTCSLAEFINAVTSGVGSHSNAMEPLGIDPAWNTNTLKCHRPFSHLLFSFLSQACSIIRLIKWQARKNRTWLVVKSPEECLFLWCRFRIFSSHLGWFYGFMFFCGFELWIPSSNKHCRMWVVIINSFAMKCQVYSFVLQIIGN